jgi:hypothetical protein
MVRYFPYYYLCSFQKIASHGSYDEMLMTTNKRWNYFITLPPAVREDALPVSSPSPMHRRHCRRCTGVFAIVVIAIVALVARRRAGVVAHVVIVVVGIVVSCGVINVVVRHNRRRRRHQCRQRCHPSKLSPLLSLLSSIVPLPSMSSLLSSS